MSAGDIVTDLQLSKVLQLAENVRQQSLAILDLLDSFHGEELHDATEEEQLAVTREQKTLNAHLALLRSVNRKVIFHVRAAKQETAEARQEIDGLHLELQNLYYEQSHLRSEILGCHEYDHKYRSLPMLSFEEFITEFPEHNNSSEHDQTIARIQHESASRLALHHEKEELLKRKDALVKEATAKKDELTKLDVELEAWFDKHEVIAKTFGARTFAIGKVPVVSAPMEA